MKILRQNFQRNSAELKQRCDDLTEVQPYRCPSGSKSEPPADDIVDASINGMASQRVHSVIHKLSRTDNNGARPTPVEQCVPAYSRAQSCRHPPLNRRKPYYHSTYNEPPNKSVLYIIMIKLLAAMQEKSIPFAF